MTSTLTSLLPVVTTRRVDIKPGQSFSVQDFLLSLKSHELESSPACSPTPTQQVHRPKNPIPSKNKVAEAGVLDPSKSIPVEDNGQHQDVLKSSASANEDLGLASDDLPAARGSWNKTRKMLRTYTKKNRRRRLGLLRDQSDSPSLFCSHPLVHDHALRSKPNQCSLLVPTTSGADGSTESSRSSAPKERKRQPLRTGTTETSGEIGLASKSDERQKKKPKKRKMKRRSPINELALVKELPLYEEPLPYYKVRAISR